MARMILWRETLAWSLLAAGLGLTGWQGWQWLQASQVNQVLANPKEPIEKHAPWLSQTPEGQLLQAWQLTRRGDSTHALEIYGRLEQRLPPALLARAKYNMGNTYLSTALGALTEEGALAYNQAAPLLAMAKDAYRDALRHDPTLWDARHNMELAQRASPDLTPGIRNEQSQEETELKTTTERAWPTIPGFPKGMP